MDRKERGEVGQVWRSRGRCECSGRGRCGRKVER